MSRNVKTFLWRTLCVQAIRSRSSMLVLGLVCMAGGFYWATTSHKGATPLSKDSGTMNVSSAFMPPQVTHIVYAPKNDYTDELMVAVADEIASRLKATITHEEESNGGDSAATSTTTDAPESAVQYKPAELIALTDAAAVIKRCKELVNQTKDSNQQSVLCLTASAPAIDSPSLAFKLYTPVATLSEARKEFPLGSSHEVFQSFERSVVYQQIIEQEHLKLQSEKFRQTQLNYEVHTAAMPGWVFKGIVDEYETLLPHGITMGCMFFMVAIIAAIKEENENGTSEHQCVMGLSDAEFFWGHYLTALLTFLIPSCVAIAVMYLAGSKEHPYGPGMNLSMLIVSFVMFAIQGSLLTILTMWVFPTGWMCMSVLFIQSLSGPILVPASKPMSLPSYFLLSKKSKLTAAVFPHTSLYCVLKIICIARDYEGGASWSLLTRGVLDRDNVTIGELWGMTLICIVVMAFLTWYLSKVLPWSTNTPQSPIFCFLPSYWREEPAVAAVEKMTVRQDAYRFEELQPGDKVIIATDNLTKVFGAKSALNGLNLKVCASKITVLLGHNGAGKTTLMSILTGMQAPTSGRATVCGYDVSSQRYQVRQRVSFCQQTDIFFEDMTCTENVYYFGSLKGVKYERLAQSIKDTLRLVRLDDKASSLPKTLSGGMKRRLSIAMTLVSEPELLILDEPTAGMDPETRRTVWDTLTTVAKERTLLLSSHDMEEADAIADQIIIMASGGTVCSGSTAFLKKACGVGYKLTFSKVPNAFNLDEVMHIVRKTTPAAVIDDEKQEEVSIALGTLDNKEFPAMFKKLESSFQRLGVASMGVIVASMKDVYLKINLDWSPGGKARERPVEGKDIDGVCKPITKRCTMARSFFALTVKRLISLVRTWDGFIFFFLVPLAMVGMTELTLEGKSKANSVRQFNETYDIPVELGVHFPKSHTVIGESSSNDLSRNLRTLVEAQGCSVHSSKDVEKDLRKYAEEDFPSYITTYALAVAFESNDIRMVPNPTSALTLPVTINLVDTAWLRALTAQPAAHINVTFAYVPTGAKTALRSVLMAHALSWVYWVMGPSMSYCWAFCQYCTFPLAERLSGARDVQLMTGLSGFDYISAHFLFDFIYHVLFTVSWCGLHYGLNSYSLTTAGLFVLGFVSAGPLVIALGYLAAEFLQPVMTAASWLLGGLYMGGLITSLSINGLLYFTKSTSHVPHYVALIVPPYALCSMLIKIWNSVDMIKQCKALEEIGVSEMGSYLGLECSGGILQFSYNGIGIELTVILAEGLLLIAFMIFMASGYLPSRHALASQELPAEQDVEEEKKRVNAARQREGLAGYSLLAWSLHKWFGTLHAVRGIYLALRPSECFGLLGVNGAGKTTTFQMLAALISVSNGDAVTAVARLSGNVRQWQSQISYCFQLGGLLDRMNAYEYLYLVGRLRGIPENELKPMIDSVLSVVDLTEHASKECGVYSGGNRRKLSIAAALLGLPPLVFLDEPYAGVDVVSRNKIFRAIAEIKKHSQTTFVLTSHNMDECEFSCDRLTIMVSGQMMCLGTLQHLREKFGQGYRLEFFFKPSVTFDEAKFKHSVEKQFPGIQLKGAQKNLLSYHLVERIPWSELFTKVEHLQKHFPLEHALVGENTLQDIFLNFAKGQESLHVTGDSVAVDVPSASNTKSAVTTSAATTPSS